MSDQQKPLRAMFVRMEVREAGRNLSHTTLATPSAIYKISDEKVTHARTVPNYEAAVDEVLTGIRRVAVEGTAPRDPSRTYFIQVIHQKPEVEEGGRLE